MKKLITGVQILAVFLSIVSCSGSSVPNSPIGTYSFGSTSFILDNKGAFSVEHLSSADDRNHYIIKGTYTYTHDHTDTENEISYGKIDVTVTELALNGTTVTSLDFTPIHAGIDISKGQKFLGWWKYVNLITYAGKMRIGFNLPFKGYRPEDVDTGRDWLIIGDPKKP